MFSAMSVQRSEAHPNGGWTLTRSGTAWLPPRPPEALLATVRRMGCSEQKRGPGTECIEELKCQRTNCG